MPAQHLISYHRVDNLVIYLLMIFEANLGDKE